MTRCTAETAALNDGHQIAQLIEFHMGVLIL
jgi:hypothetical protein